MCSSILRYSSKKSDLGEAGFITNDEKSHVNLASKSIGRTFRSEIT